MRGRETKPGELPEPGAPEPFWSVDELLGEGRFSGEAFTIRLKAHPSTEHYRHLSRGDEIVALPSRAGCRQYVLARPYILEPEISLTVGLYPRRREDGAVGEVTASAWEGMRHVEIGSAQAWLYVEARTLVLWECLLHDRYKQPDPFTDPNLHTLWQGFERFLLARFPDAHQLVTPAWEPLYEPERWQTFLRSRGFSQVSQQAFGKEVAGGP